MHALLGPTIAPHAIRPSALLDSHEMKNNDSRKDTDKADDLHAAEGSSTLAVEEGGNET